MSWLDRIRPHVSGRVLKALADLRTWVFPPRFQFDPEFLETNQWAREYVSAGQADVYPRLAAFAERYYDTMAAVSDSLDKKADDLIKFALAVTGVVVAAVSSGLVSFANPVLAVFASVSILVAIFTALIARTPTTSSTPMSPRDLLKIADLESRPSLPQIEGVIAVSYHVAILGMRILTTWKARQLSRATLSFFLGFVLLLASIIPF